MGIVDRAKALLRPYTSVYIVGSSEAISTEANITGSDSAVNTQFLLDVVRGNVPGYSYLEKFGENPDVDTATVPEDIWDYGGLYTFSTEADITTISSSSADDSQTLTVIGLDSNWLPVTQVKALNGQSKVTLDTPLVRVYRMYNSGSANFVGTIYCYVDGAITAGVPNVSTTVRAVITPGNNQTLMAIYTIPAGKTGYLVSESFTVSKGVTASFADFARYVREFGGVFQVKHDASAGSESGGHTRPHPFPTPLPAKSDIICRCTAASSNNMGISAEFDILLIDN